ncbi:MAG: ATP-binding cassette domain-containing protein [Burkholderiales bacterium]|nr:ATP-binding cassette domain-containing protein [Burkholderiales bacterium]
MIEVKDLRKQFGSVKAVDGVTFTGKSGAITGLLGPNGAGKTTAIRMIGTLIAIDSGAASIDGIDVATDADGARCACGLLTDSRGVYTRMTARENIRYYAELRGVEAARSEKTLARFVDWLDMKDILDRRTEGFSQGERMKVAIVRALIHEPANVILDEPTNGLDVMSTRALRELIKRLKSDGQTVMFSSHVMQEVAALCDEIIIISHGRVTAQGTTEQLMEMSGKNNLEDAFIALSDVSQSADAHKEVA